MNASAAKIGIIGGGQLARMMYTASIALELPIKLLAEGPEVSAAQIVHDVIVGDYRDPQTVLDFANDCAVVTFDHEHVPPAILRELLARQVAVRPGPDALIHAHDKAVMRRRLSALGVPCPTFEVVADSAALGAFGDANGWPVIAKAAVGGYDGKGVFLIGGPGGTQTPFDQVGVGVEIVAEEFGDFARELSVLVVRRPGGQQVAYPVSETVQTDGVCTTTITPAPDLGAETVLSLQQLGMRIANQLDVVGVLAVELMQAKDGRIVVNELAMRPHNTGHWTIDGAATSQFENHLRAVADLPLGPAEARPGWTVMVNVLGSSLADLRVGLAKVLTSDAGVRAHLYGKEIRPGRKLGHVTVLDEDLDRARARAQWAANQLMGVTDE